jgi:hypothetical protein
LNARPATLPFTALMIITSLGVAAAQVRFSQTAPFPRRQVTPPQQQRERLFPVQPFEAAKAAQAPAPQANPATPVPPALLLETLRNLPNLKPRVVCGMTLIPANPSVDPKIGQRHDAKKPKNATTYTIRPVQPSICR